MRVHRRKLVAELTHHLPLCLLPAAAASAFEEPMKTISTAEGTWRGAIRKAGGMRPPPATARFARRARHLSYDGQHDQGINGFPRIAGDGNRFQIHLELPTVHALYDQDRQFRAQFDDGFQRQEDRRPTERAFHRSDQILELRQPQDREKKPYPYEEEELTFTNAKARTALAATLTVPRRAGYRLSRGDPVRDRAQPRCGKADGGH